MWQTMETIEFKSLMFNQIDIDECKLSLNFHFNKYLQIDFDKILKQKFGLFESPVVPPRRAFAIYGKYLIKDINKC